MPELFYTGYGLTIRSPIQLNEFLSTSATKEDVRITWGADTASVSSLRETDRQMDITGDEARFWFEASGFVVKNGSEIVVIPNGDPPDESLVRLYVEGMMMAMILHQRGMCVLHASVVEVHGEAVAFLGHVGSGKSSLAAALYSRGHRVIADDNAAIEIEPGPPVVRSAYPYVKLFPAIAASLGFQNGNLGLLHPSQVKLAGCVNRGFQQDLAPLKRIYFIGRTYEPDLRRLSLLETTIELIRNSVPTRWGHPGDGRQLRNCAMLAAQVPAYTIKTFDELASIPGLAATIESHCERERQRSPAPVGALGARGDSGHSDI